MATANNAFAERESGRNSRCPPGSGPDTNIYVHHDTCSRCGRSSRDPLAAVCFGCDQRLWLRPKAALGNTVSVKDGVEKLERRTTKTRKGSEIPQEVLMELPLGCNQEEILLFIFAASGGRPSQQVPWRSGPRPSRCQSAPKRARLPNTYSRSLLRLERRGLVVRRKNGTSPKSHTISVELTQAGWEMATRLAAIDK
jgi:hypothetical protein